MTRGAVAGVAAAGLLLGACGDDLELPCAASSARTCLILRIEGQAAGGELGFRFSAPLDMDGDGVADVAAGARFTQVDAYGVGTAGAWSGRTGEPLSQWTGEVADGLFGHAVLTVPDLDGDGLADIVVAAPNAREDGEPRGLVYAFSPARGQRLWRLGGEIGEGLGWHLARIADLSGDGVEEILAGAPSSPVQGKVYLIDGRRGEVLKSYDSPGVGDTFGWYVAATADLDGDGDPDVLVGAPTTVVAGEVVGAAHLLSSGTGAVLLELAGETAGGKFGEVVEAIDDLDGDGVGDLAIGAPGDAADPARGPGAVQAYSSRTGARLFRLVGRQDGELFGRMVAAVGDLDGDGTGDLAIGAPWHGDVDAPRAGRIELRSGQALALLAELSGSAPERWLGWHIVGADGLIGGRRRGLVVSALLEHGGAGALELHAYDD